MAIGALLNQLGSMTSALSGIGSMMSGLGSVASSIGAALSKAFQKAWNAASDAFKKIKEFAEDHLWPLFEPLFNTAKTVFFGLLGIAKTVFNTMRTIFNEVLLPIWGVMKDMAMIWYKVFTGKWREAMGDAEKLGKEKLLPFFRTLTGLPGKLLAKGLSTARTLVGNLISFGSSAIGGLVDRIKSEFSNVADVISGVFTRIFNGIMRVYNATVGKAVSAIKGVFGAVRGAAGDLGGGASDAADAVTNVGTAVAGSISQVFNLNIDISGMTDRSDKREMAREISKMIEQELGRTLRASGGSRFSR
jgi:phage-related protein|tara:strand:- start:1506 stop:2417 length:912 start_codon:yes stop_codon:yes gene_type:complete